MAKTLKGVMTEFAALQRELATASEASLREVAEPVLKRSQELVPVDTGRLRDSGFIATERTPNGARAVVGYARDGDPDYAITVEIGRMARIRTPGGQQRQEVGDSDATAAVEVPRAGRGEVAEEGAGARGKQ